MLLLTTSLVPVAPRPARAASAAFTLIEIILAIALATGLLLVALMFYRQAAALRGQILQESDRISALRLTLDRLAGDLRAAQPKAAAGREFSGDSSSIRFMKEAVNLPPWSARAWRNRQDTDLVRVSLGATTTATNGAGLTVTGLSFKEEPLSASGTTVLDDSAINLPLTPGGDARRSTAPIPVDDSANNASSLPLGQTNHLERPLLDFVRFVRFRYWDGNVWQPGWTNVAPPPGVEIVFATEAVPEGLPPEAYPPEAFRRVVFLPSGVASPPPQDATLVGTVSP
jgi:type II secretory pathway component PulJ